MKGVISVSKTVRYYNWDCNVKIEKYSKGGYAILLEDMRDGSPVATATLNIKGLRDNEVAIKNYSENEGILDVLVDAHVITEPIRYEQSGYVKIPVCLLIEE